MLDIKKIVTNPLQPRQDFDRDKLQELANSIKEGELLQPIVVRNNGGNTFEIVAGERRFKAFQILKEKRIPAIVREISDDTDALEKSLIENLQRDDLTSVERENAIGDLWESKRYKTYKDLANKLGLSESRIGKLLHSRKERKQLTIGPTVSTDTIDQTRGMKFEARKKLLKSAEEKGIGERTIREISRKIKEFPEPEQQLEILNEFEEQDDLSREAFDDIIRKKKEIVEGEREPEHIVEIESDNDKRMLDDYYYIKNSVFDISADHISHFKNEESRQEAIDVIQSIISYLNKQLVELGEIEEVDI